MLAERGNLPRLMDALCGQTIPAFTVYCCVNNREGWSDEEKAAFTANPVFERRPETLSVEDFLDLTNLLT